MPTQARNLPQPSPGAVGALFFASGATSLGLELVWTKQLGVLLGGTTAAVAWVVALFMGGMALGYALGGRFAARVARPVRAYGICELAVAGWGAAAVVLLARLPPDWSAPAAYLACGALILPCTVLAGATLPLLVAGVGGSASVAMGRLYALNTFGAVVGVLATGLVGIGALGVSGTGYAVAALAGLVGLAAWTLPQSADSAPAQPPGETASERPATAWLLAAFLTGFASLGEEVLWTRALTAQFNASTYAFAAILAVFLLGLAMGAAAAARLLGRGGDPVRWLVATQVAASFLVAWSPLALQVAESAVPGYVGIRQLGGHAAWVAMLGAGLLRTALALLPPTILLGFALPLVVGAGAGRLPAARATAWLAGANAAGAVLGSLAARFALLPLFGVVRGLAALAVIHGALAFVAARALLPPAVHLGAVLGWLAVAVATLPQAQPPLGRLTRGHKLLLLDEGVQDTTAVVQMGSAPPVRQIVSNGIAYAGDSPGARRYMRLLGHLPALVAKGQDRALVVCLGTGMTAAAVLRHPGIVHADLVDISPVVDRTLRLFGHVNDEVWTSPRGHVHLQDGRVFVARAPAASYDVIALEPPPPRVAGVSALYSLQFYQQARRVLKAGGAVVQWLPLHGMTEAELRMLARTFQAAFADARLIRILDVEGALLATNGPGADEAEIGRRLAVRGVADQLADIGAGDPRTLPTVAGEVLRQRLGPGPIVTDDDPRIEQFAAGLPEFGAGTDSAGLVFARRVWGM